MSTVAERVSVAQISKFCKVSKHIPELMIVCNV